MATVIGFETEDDTGTSYEAFERKTIRLRSEAIGSYALLSESRFPPAVSSIRFSTSYDVARATPCFVFVSKPDEDHDETRQLRNILVHGPDTSLTTEAFDYIQRLVELLKSFHEASQVSIKPQDFFESWTPSDASAAYNSISRWLHGATRQLEVWTDDKNERRCDLVDREIDGTLTEAERIELEDLQNQMLAYRRRIAPRPIAEARRVHQQLLRDAAEQQD